LNNCGDCGSAKNAPGWVQIGVDGAVRPRAHRAFHAQHELGARLVGHRKRQRRVRGRDHLHHAAAVAQVDENHAAVVAAVQHPAGQRDALADVGAAQLAA